MTLDDHLAEYKCDGYTAFRSYRSPEKVRSWLELMDPEFEPALICPQLCVHIQSSDVATMSGAGAASSNQILRGHM